MACWLPNHLAHCGEDLPQLLSHQRHLEVSFCMAALSKTTLSTTNNFDKLSKTTWQQQIKTKLFCSTWISTQCSWAGANSWLLPVPSQDRGEYFEQSTKSSTRAWSWKTAKGGSCANKENDLNDNNMIGRWITKTRMDNCRLNWTWSR